MVFQQKVLGEAYLIVKMTAPAMAWRSVLTNGKRLSFKKSYAGQPALYWLTTLGSFQIFLRAQPSCTFPARLKALRSE